MNTEKTVGLIECYGQLENALNELTDLDDEDENLTAIWWQIKDTIDSVNKYLKEITK